MAQQTQYQSNNTLNSPPKASSHSDVKIIIIILAVVFGFILITMVALALLVRYSLNSAREKARLSAGRGTLSSLPAALAICRDMKATILPPQIEVNSPICQDPNNTPQYNLFQSNYPDLSSTGWRYTGIANPNSDSVSVTAECPIKVCDKQNATTGICTIRGCNFTPN